MHAKFLLRRTVQRSMAAALAIALAIVLVSCTSKAESQFEKLVRLWDAAGHQRSSLDAAEVRRITGSTYSDEAIHQGRPIKWSFDNRQVIFLSDYGFELAVRDSSR